MSSSPFRAFALSLQFSSLIVLLLSCFAGWASDPSSDWNVDGQVRTRSCVPLLLPTATLRFPDGTPTGFYAYGDDPSKNGSAADCTNGTTEIDAQEVLHTGTGLDIYFRPGGGPDQYLDAVNKGQYGHIWSAELANQPALQPLNLNGKPCVPTTAASNSFVVNLIGVADDGAIYAGNLSTAMFPPQFVLYRWASEGAQQTVVFAGDPGNGNTNSTNQRWGDTLAVRGAGTNTQILICSRGTLAAVLAPSDSTMTAFTATTLNSDLAAAGFGTGLAFGNGSAFWAACTDGTNSSLRQFSFDPFSGLASTVQIYGAGTFPVTVGPIGAMGTNNLMAALDLISGPDLLRLYDISNAPALLDRKQWVAANDNPYASGAVVFSGTNRLYALDSDNGLTAFTIASVATNPLPPLLFLSPTNLSVLAGSNAVFMGAADGSLPLKYQWQFNFADIPGATGSSLTISNAHSTSTGSYRVVVTNSEGAVTSAPASLTVVATNVPSALLAYEPFAYAAGSVLAGQGNWVLNSGASGTVQPGNLSVPFLAPARNNHFTWTSASMSIRLPIGPFTNGVLYFSFPLRITSVGAGTSDTIAGFALGTTTTFSPKLNVASNATGAFNLGLYKGTGLMTGGLATNVFKTNDIVFVVARYVFNDTSGTDDTCDLWLNPPAASFGATNPPAPSLADVGAGAARTDMSQIDRFFFRSASTAAQIDADELRIGRSWAAVTAPAALMLGINLTGTTGEVYWLGNGPNFLLEQSPTLASSQWSTVTNSATPNGTNKFVQITTTNGSRFYRLRGP